MPTTPTILLVDDDEGHVFLVQQNLKRSGVTNPVETFSDGQEILDFLFMRDNGPKRVAGQGYLLLLDIRMPKVDGAEVLRQVRTDSELRKLPIIMLTTTDDPREVARCHALGCSIYLQKPVDYGRFAEAIQKLGLFLPLLQVPLLNGKH